MNSLDTTIERAVPAAGMPSRTRAGLVCLVAGAVSITIGRALTADGGSPAQRVEQATQHSASMTASVLLAVLGFAALIPGLLCVAGLVRDRGARLATIGAGLTVAGCAGFVVLVSVDMTNVATAQVSSPVVMAQLLHALDVSPAILAITPIAVIGYFFGPFLVTLGARRAGFVPRWLPWAVLGCLVLQPVGVALGGPHAARLLDTGFQLVLVGLLSVLARRMATVR